MAGQASHGMRVSPKKKHKNPWQWGDLCQRATAACSSNLLEGVVLHKLVAFLVWFLLFLLTSQSDK